LWLDGSCNSKPHIEAYTSHTPTLRARTAPGLVYGSRQSDSGFAAQTDQRWEKLSNVYVIMISQLCHWRLAQFQ
jgi:hypothetical protein